MFKEILAIWVIFQLLLIGIGGNGLLAAYAEEGCHEPKNAEPHFLLNLVPLLFFVTDWQDLDCK